VLVQVPGKRLQHRVRPALAVHRPGQVGVQALDSHADGPDAPLRSVPAPPRIPAQILGDLLQFAERLGLHWRNFVPDLRAVTLYELEDLVRIAGQKNKHVILIARQCGMCERTRAEALRPLLTNPNLKVFSTLVMDAATAKELLA